MKVGIIILQVADVKTTAELQSLLSNEAFDFRFACGYTKPTHQLVLKDASEIVHSVWLHYVLFCPHTELEQLRKGLLETLQVQLLVSLHDDGIRALLSLFDVTVEYLQDMFVIQYSLNGSNDRTKEEAIIIHWFEYIYNSKGKYVYYKYIVSFYTLDPM